MKHRYGEFNQNQISETKKRIRTQIFFLLLIVDPKTSSDFKDIDVSDAIENVLQALLVPTSLSHKSVFYRGSHFLWRRA
jgi:hypothetical protein